MKKKRSKFTGLFWIVLILVAGSIYLSNNGSDSKDLDRERGPGIPERRVSSEQTTTVIGEVQKLPQSTFEPETSESIPLDGFGQTPAEMMVREIESNAYSATNSD